MAGSNLIQSTASAGDPRTVSLPETMTRQLGGTANSLRDVLVDVNAPSGLAFSRDRSPAGQLCG